MNTYDSVPDKATHALYAIMRLLDAGDKEEAKKRLYEFLTIDPNNANAWHLKGLLSGDIGEQLAALDRARLINAGRGLNT